MILLHRFAGGSSVLSPLVLSILRLCQVSAPLGFIMAMHACRATASCTSCPKRCPAGQVASPSACTCSR